MHKVVHSDRAESGIMEARISRHNNEASSNIPAKVTEMVNLPARSVESHTGDLDKLGGQTDAHRDAGRRKRLENT